jgi:hypothetical protein
MKVLESTNVWFYIRSCSKIARVVQNGILSVNAGMSSDDISSEFIQ